MPTQDREKVEQAYRERGWTVEHRKGGGVTFSKPDPAASPDRFAVKSAPIERTERKTSNR